MPQNDSSLLTPKSSLEKNSSLLTPKSSLNSSSLEKSVPLFSIDSIFDFSRFSCILLSDSTRNASDSSAPVRDIF